MRGGLVNWIIVEKVLRFLRDIFGRLGFGFLVLSATFGFLAAVFDKLADPDSGRLDVLVYGLSALALLFAVGCSAVVVYRLLGSPNEPCAPAKP